MATHYLSQADATGVIYLPLDLPGHAAGDTYVLQEDLTFAGSGIVVGADNITIDLNGKTLTYGTGGQKYCYGIALPPASSWYDYWTLSDITTWAVGNNATIKNGSIQQAKISAVREWVGDTGAPYLSACIIKENGTTITIFGVTIGTWGKDTWPIIVMNTSGLADIHDNIINEESSQITNRTTLHGSISLESSQGACYAHVYNNEIYGSPQTGIKIAGSAPTGANRNLVYNNIIQHNARVANCFGVHIWASSGSVDYPIGIYDNQIVTWDPDPTNTHGGSFDPAPTGFPTKNGRGIGVEGGSTYVDITGNYVDVCYEPLGASNPQNVQYQEASAALKFEGPTHCIARNNTFIAHGASRYVEEDSDLAIRVQTARGIAVAISPGGADGDWPITPNYNLIENNTIKAIEEGGQYYPDGGSDAQYPYSAPFEFSALGIGSHITVRDNDCYSNDRFMVLTYAAYPPGDTTQQILPDDDFIFDGNKFTLDTTGEMQIHGSDPYTGQEPTFIQMCSLGWTILNPDADDIDLRTCDAGWNWNYNSFNVAFDGEIYVKDSSDNPIEGHQITIVDNNDVTVFEGTTDSNGKAVDASGASPRISEFTRWTGTLSGGEPATGLIEHGPWTAVHTFGESQESTVFDVSLDWSETFIYDTGATITKVVPDKVYTGLPSVQKCLVKGFNFVDGADAYLEPTGASSPFITETSFIDVNTLEVSVNTAALVHGDEGFFDLVVALPDATVTLTDAIEVRYGANLGTLTLRPNARGLRTQLAPEGLASNWANVDEAVANDSDYNHVSVTGSGTLASDFYKLNYSSSVGVGTIRAVTIYNRSWYQQKSSSGDAIVSPALYVPLQTTNVGSSVEVTNTPTLYSDQFAYNPLVQRAWSWSDINGMQASVSLAASASAGETTDVRTSQVYVEVSYDPYLKTLETTTAAAITPLTPSVDYSGSGSILLVPTGEGTFSGTDWDIDGGASRWEVVANPDQSGYIEAYQSTGVGELASEYLEPTGGVLSYVWPTLVLNDGWSSYNNWWKSVGDPTSTYTDIIYFENPVNRDDDIDYIILRWNCAAFAHSTGEFTSGDAYAELRAGLRINGTDYLGTGVVVENTDWTNYEDTYYTNPDTDSAWTYEDLDDIQGVLTTYLEAINCAVEGLWTFLQIEVVSGTVAAEESDFPISFLLSALPEGIENTRITLVEPVVYSKAINPSATGTTIDIGVYDGIDTNLAPTINNLTTNWIAYDAEIDPTGEQWAWSEVADLELYVNAGITTDGEDRAVDISYGGLRVSFNTIRSIEPLDAIELTWTPNSPTVSVSSNEATGAIATGTIEALSVEVGVGAIDIDATSVGFAIELLDVSLSMNMTAAGAVESVIEPLEVSVTLGVSARSVDATGVAVTPNPVEISLSTIDRTGEWAAFATEALEVTVTEGFSRELDYVELGWTPLAVSTSIGTISRSGGIATFATSVPPVSVLHIPDIYRTTNSAAGVIGIPVPTVTYAPDYTIGVTRVAATVSTLRPFVSYIPGPFEEQMVYPLQSDGIENDNERSFFEYRPSIEYSPPATEVSDLDAMFEGEIAPELAAEDSSFLEDVVIYGKKIEELGELIRAQQMFLRLLVDPLERPDVAKAVEYFRSTPDITIDLGTPSAPVITYPLYDRCYKIIYEAPVTSVGGDIHGIKTKREYEALAANFVEQEGKKVLLLVSRYILGISCDFLAKVSVPPLKGRLKSWSKSFKTIKFSTNMSNDDGPLDEAFSAGDSILGDAVTSTKGESGYEAVGYATLVLEYTHSRAREGDTPGASPGSFYARPVYEHILTSNDAATLTTHTGMLSSAAYRLSDKKLKVTPKTDEEKELLELTASREGDKKPSYGYTALRDRGLGSSILAVDDMTAALKTWYEGPELICCIVDRLGAVGKIDRGLLASMKAFLGYKLGRLRSGSDDVIKMGGVLDLLLMALNGALMTLIDTMMHEASGKLTSAMHLLGNSAATRACTPMDELLSVMQGELVETNIQLRSIVGTFVTSLDRRDEVTVKMAGTIRKTQRLEVFYRLLDAILNALDNGELCKESVKDKKPSEPTIEEVKRFMTNRGNPLFEDAQRGRQYIIDKYKRDPVTGEPISEFGGEADVRQKLQDCGKLQGKDLEDMVKLLSEWRQQ